MITLIDILCETKTMRVRAAKSITVAATIAGLCMIAGRPTMAKETTTQAMASIEYLRGTWHCSGGGPATNETYTMDKYWWHDTEPDGSVTSGTFDAKRQKWIIFTMGSHGGYGVNEGTASASNPYRLKLTFPYPKSQATFEFNKLSDKKYTLGRTTCTR